MEQEKSVCPVCGNEAVKCECLICHKMFYSRTKKYHCHNAECIKEATKQSNKLHDMVRYTRKYSEGVIKSLAEIQKMFPEKIGKYTRIFATDVNFPEICEKIFAKEYNGKLFGVINSSDYENITDIVIYIKDDLKDMKGILVEYEANHECSINMNVLDLELDIDKSEEYKYQKPEDFMTDHTWGYCGFPKEYGSFRPNQFEKAKKCLLMVCEDASHVAKKALYL